MDAEEHDIEGEIIVFTSPYGILAVTERRQEEARLTRERERLLAEARRTRATGKQSHSTWRAVVAKARAYFQPQRREEVSGGLPTTANGRVGANSRFA
jgi:hypothetical protein